MDLIDPSFVEGYVFDGFLKKEKYLVQKPGVWTYYFESGVINEEVFYGEEEIIKKTLNDIKLKKYLDKKEILKIFNDLKILLETLFHY